MLLISGGIDSPCGHLYDGPDGAGADGHPLVSPSLTPAVLARHKVLDLVERCGLLGRIHHLVVPFTHIQEEIRDKCAEEYFYRHYKMPV